MSTSITHSMRRVSDQEYDGLMNELSGSSSASERDTRLAHAALGGSRRGLQEGPALAAYVEP